MSEQLKNNLGLITPEKDAEGRPQPIVVQKITVRPVNRKTQDISNWRNALRAAEALIPRRTELYDLYEDILLDGHLTSVVEKRLMAVTNADWQFVDKQGKAVEMMDDFIDSPDFEELITEILNAKLWGYSMIEFNFFKDNTWSIYNIPRKHIRPELGLVAFEQNSNSGISIREGLYADTILEAGKEKDLGLLLKAAQYAIYKRGGFGDWAQYAELFGMPLVDAVWDGYDEKQRLLLLEALNSLGSGGQVVRPQGTQLEFIEGGSTNPTGELYNALIKACNAEMSKIILGQTETTESSESSGYAQAKQHGETEDDVNTSDIKFVRRILNRRVINILNRNGIDTQGGYFKLKTDNAEKIPMENRLSMDIKLRNEAKLPISDDYFYETYGIEKPENYEELKEKLEAETTEYTPFSLVHHPETAKPKKNTWWDKFLNLTFQLAPKNPFAGADINMQMLNEFYHTCCSDIQAHLPVDKILLNSQNGWIDESFIKKYFEQKVGKEEIPTDYYLNTAKILVDAIVKGIGQPQLNATPKSTRLFEQLRYNVFAFSMAKSYNVLQTMKSKLTDESGNPVSYGKFRVRVTEVDQIFNDVYLKTEYNSALSMAQAASQWEQIKDFPMLEYRTVGDSRVRKEHEDLDGLILEFSDPLWAKIYPPNGWGCRCIVIPAQPGAVVQKKEIAQKFVKENLPKYFQKNAGMKQEIFENDHPYFQLADNKKLKQLQAVANYGLPTSDKLAQKASLKAQAFETPETVKHYFEKIHPTLTTADGVVFTLDKNRYSHLLEKKEEERWKYAAQITETLKSANEVWQTEQEGIMYKKYVKYYNNQPFVFTYPIHQPEKWTFYAADKSKRGSYEKLESNTRRGLLIHKE